ncbi:MAG: nucleotidyltransferase family protein [Pseudomonadota bacterium]
MTLIDTAFLVAAGKGTRMAPLTDSIPKPFVKIGDKAILDYIFEHLVKTDVKNIVVNTHHHADLMRSYITSRAGFSITESYEPDLLETGGGLKKALPLLGVNPIFMINGDAFWTDGPSGSILQQLAQHFNPVTMDILLLLIPVQNMVLTEGVGDYDMLANRLLSRNHAKQGTHMFTGIRILSPSIMENIPEGKFSFLQQMDTAQNAGRLYGLVHDGEWHHISTPVDVNTINAQQQQRKNIS